VLGRETGRGAIGFGFLLGSLGIGAVTGAAWLPRLRIRFVAESLVAVGSLAFAVVAASAAMIRELYVLAPLMFVGGLAWITVLSTLNVAAQQAAPPWVRARALAVYLIVFQAGIAGGSLLWGAVATRAGLSVAYFGMGAGLLVSAAIAIRLRLAADANVDHTPAHHWPAPQMASEFPLDAGPIMIQVEYCVDAPNAEPFWRAMTDVGRQRRRHGVEQWWLFQDTADPTRFVETWVETTWAEHLRYHERVSVAHQEFERKAQAFMRSGTTPTTRHFIAPARRASMRAVVRAVETRVEA
jgi:hypothetical protein